MAVIAAPAPAAPMGRTVVASMMGNIMEWYDFGLYGYFASIIARLFFPSEDAFASLLATFGVFAIGFLMRPIGSAIFGHYGDRIGRKKTLAASVILMAIPTMLIGVLPTHAQVGLIAPVLLTVLRMLQGLSVGGEFTGSMSFLVEHSPPNRRAFFGAFIMAGTVVGMLLGSLVGAAATGLMPTAALESWGWRLPFLLGSVVGLIGLCLRVGMTETPSFAAAERAGDIAHEPLLDAVRNHGRDMLRIIGLTVVNAVSFYIVLVFMTTYLTTVAGLLLSQALVVSAVTALVLAATTVIAAMISDRIGRRPLVLAACVQLIVLAYPVLALVGRGDLTSALVGQAIFALILGQYFGPVTAMMVEQFPTRNRYSGLSVAFSLTLAIFGGTAPLVATYLMRATGNNLAPSFYIAVAAVVTLATVITMRETYRDSLA